MGCACFHLLEEAVPVDACTKGGKRVRRKTERTKRIWDAECGVLRSSGRIFPSSTLRFLYRECHESATGAKVCDRRATRGEQLRNVLLVQEEALVHLG